MGRLGTFVRVGLVAALTLVAVSVAKADDKVVRIGFQKYGKLVLLKGKGTLEGKLKAIGYSVEWKEFPAGPQMLEALNVGAIDFGNTGETPPIFAQAAGAPLVYVAYEPPAPKGEAILVPQDSPLKSVADLKGKKVAVTKAAGSHYLLVAVLASAHLSSKDISPAFLTPADGRAAFVSKNVDAWVAWDPFLTTALRQNGGRVLADGQGLASYKRYYLASESYARSHGDVLKVIYSKLDETGKWVKANPKEAASLLAGEWKIDAATVEEANSHRSYKVGTVTQQGLAEQKKIADAFFAEGLLPKKVETTDVTLWQPTN